MGSSPQNSRVDVSSAPKGITKNTGINKKVKSNAPPREQQMSLQEPSFSWPPSEAEEAEILRILYGLTGSPAGYRFSLSFARVRIDLERRNNRELKVL
ncbi:hypothetical protein HPP92_013375 [Vanilla planifolia]|uniref:Uncharacterized protein n=1 Tax=Vanilla planifolia TaxID=51239 RepID=A0A835QUS9_VANPL|nr:hypothetical protein HPP92_013375 [Vanilla planifolia]